MSSSRIRDLPVHVLTHWHRCLYCHIDYRCTQDREECYEIGYRLIRPCPACRYRKITT